ncbi:fibronectin type III domain-containing protein [Halobacteria archaeon AArc-m2/3/4]|uniref:Fibronectin type III domain-containing protein n=1 Tax=Natronoglomus mannanivorans TaxID=2979990 RepID=A0ABT2QCT4_9EURY|nr:fibronectin type III domain-containing protein [Halobacteria archaeon AArc-m2/3/4]
MTGDRIHEQTDDRVRTGVSPGDVSRRRVLRAGSALFAGTALGNTVGTAPGRVGTEPGTRIADDTLEPLLDIDFEEIPTGPYEPQRREWGGNDLSIVADEYLSIVDDGSRQILEGYFPEGVAGAGNGNGGGDFIVDLGEPYEELYCAYRIRFDEGFEFHQPGGKLPGLAGTDGTSRSITGGDVPDGENGWSARMMWRDPPNPADGGLVMFYTYHPDMPEEYGENMYWDDGPSGQVHFQPGRWHRIEHRVVMNTPDEHDGILEGWFDGEKAFERRDLRFRDVPELGIDDFYFSLFFGGGQTDHWAHDREERIAFDDVVVSPAPIWLGDDEPPTVPTGLTVEEGETDPTAVDCSWEPSEDVGSSGLAGYRVFQNGRLREETTATATTVDRVIAGETHEFGVSAVDTAGNESARATATVTTESIDDSTAPPAPDELHRIARQLEWLEVSWSPVTDDGSGLAGYDVFVDGNHELRVGPETTTARVSGLASGTSYEVGVSAIDLAGNTSPVTTITAATVAGVDESEDGLLVHDFSAWPGGNALGEWAGGGDFENGGSAGEGEVVSGALRLEYDDSGWLRSYVDRDVSEYDRLTMLVRGDRGGEENHVVLTLDDVSGRLSSLSADAIGTDRSAVRIDLEDAGVPAAPSDLHLSFTEGGAGALEIHEIRFGRDSGNGGEPTPPPAPSALEVTERTSASVSLEWDAHEETTAVETYVVWVDGSVDHESTGTETTVTGLEAETTYEFGVTVVDGDGSESATVTTTARTRQDRERPPNLEEYTPQDTTGDGLYDDVTGSGQTTTTDVTVFFEHVDEPAVTEYPQYYDFDGNGRVSVTDVVALFESI